MSFLNCVAEQFMGIHSTTIYNDKEWCVLRADEKKEAIIFGFIKKAIITIAGYNWYSYKLIVNVTSLHILDSCRR